jgi:hypothetical protein
MKIILKESQINKLMEQEILKIPAIELFGDWNTLQKFLERRGNPPYTIGGNVNLYGSDVTDLGNLISVGGFLDLKDSKIESLGNLQTVGGYLHLQYAPIESLGNLRSVGGDLYLRGTPIAKKYTLGQIRKMINVKGAIFL